MIYEATIQYITRDKNGNDKVVKENYIINGIDVFAEAETILYDAFKDLTDIDVIAIKRSKVTEIINKRTNDDERIFFADIISKYTNEDGEESVTSYKMALFAENFDKARLCINDYMKQGYTDLELVGLRQTRIMDVL